jgi:cephalosporin hydroxylase
MIDFTREVEERIAGYAQAKDMQAAAKAFLALSVDAKYSYNFSWLSRPIIQYPQDIQAMQEVIWKVQPDLIVETGIAHGGSLIFSASMLAMIDYAEAVKTGASLNPRASKRRVLGIDIDIRAHNRAAIEAHPFAHLISTIQGSSIDPATVKQVHDFTRGYQKVLVCLDSNHTHDHVLAELEAYAPLTSADSYCVVFDTLIEDMPANAYPDRPWGVGDNPRTAVREYLARIAKEGRKATDGKPLRFEVDEAIDLKLQLGVAPGGYLRRVSG